MKLPKKIYIGNSNMRRTKITLPSKKVLEFVKGMKPYVTSDEEEIKFLSKQRGLVITDLDNKEIKRYFQDFNFPIINNANIGVDNADKYKWATELEETVYEILKDKGYTAYRRKDVDLKDVNFIKELEECGFVVNKTDKDEEK